MYYKKKDYIYNILVGTQITGTQRYTLLFKIFMKSKFKTVIYRYFYIVLLVDKFIFE